MADTFKFELVAPERLLLSTVASEVVIPASEGEMTVMSNHAPTMATIRPGVVSVKTEAGQTERYVVFGGFADIVPSGCTLLAEAAVPVAEFSKASLEKRIENAKTDLSNAVGDDSKTRLAQLIADLGSLASIAA